MVKQNEETPENTIFRGWGDVWPKYKSCFAMPVTECPVIQVTDRAKAERDSYFDEYFDELPENMNGMIADYIKAYTLCLSLAEVFSEESFCGIRELMHEYIQRTNMAYSDKEVIK